MVRNSNKEEEAQECDLKNCFGKHCHWIILRKDGRAIWKQTYKTKADALLEYDFEKLQNYGEIKHKFKK